jgi:rhodanese-related sulfurtransferase
MVEKVGHEEVQRLLGDGAEIVEVLPRAEYDEFHIRDAISIPLKELRSEAIQALNRQQPVVVYCFDGL